MTANLRGTLREVVFRSRERHPGAEFRYSVYLPDIGRKPPPASHDRKPAAATLHSA